MNVPRNVADADRTSGEEERAGLSNGEQEGREIQFQSPVSLVTLIAMNRRGIRKELENITYGATVARNSGWGGR